MKQDNGKLFGQEVGMQRMESGGINENGTQKQYWLSGYNHDGWKWVTDEECSYFHWASDEPNAYRNNENFAQIYRLGNPKNLLNLGNGMISV